MARGSARPGPASSETGGTATGAGLGAVRSLGAGGIVGDFHRPRFAMLERRDRGLDVAALLLLAAQIPKLLELGIVVGILNHCDRGRPAALIKCLVQARFGDVRGHW